MQRLIECTSCGVLHAVDALTCPHCGQPLDPANARQRIADRKALRAERSAGRISDALMVVGVGLVALVVVVVVAFVLTMAAVCAGGGAAVRSTRHHVEAAPLPAEAPPPVEPERHD